MSAPVLERAPELPRTALLTRARPTAQRLVRSRWRVEQHHADRVPRTGPVVLVANHVGWLDGPLLAICAPRPVHAWTKVEMFAGRLGGFLLAAGQIPVDRDRVDARAVRTALGVLEHGGVVGVFPEGLRGAGDMASTRAGAAYLALVSGAPVVPVAFLGTREPGGGADALPPRGARITMTYGAPLELGRHPWPRTTSQLRAAHDQVTRAVVATIGEAERTTGLRLPGPLGPAPTTPEESTTHD